MCLQLQIYSEADTQQHPAILKWCFLHK